MGIRVMQNQSLLGVCLICSAIIIALAIVYHANSSKDTNVGRFQYSATSNGYVVLDTATGQIVQSQAIGQ
jgi:hypothetical protein